jgi:methionyl aminopeptidase
MDERIAVAGRLASEALEYGASLITKGVLIGEVIDAIESFVSERDAIVAFPPQISMDSFAAHDTARIDDDRILSGVVKLDVGVSYDGFIGDNALTIDLSGEHTALLEACRGALDAAIAAAAPREPIDLMSRAIEEAITAAGFTPVANLSGHGVARFEIHTSPNVPNVAGARGSLEPGMTVAIEPFATSGYGRIKDSGEPEVFRQVAKRSVRDPIARPVLARIAERRGLPISARWLAHEFGAVRAKHALNVLVQNRILTSYAPLREVQDGVVAQFERTIHVLNDQIVVTTPWEWP